MMRIECPAKNQEASGCDWIPRNGSVRDSSDTGIIECQVCHLTTHSTDLSHEVNYDIGTMHDWAAGYGDSLPGPESDKLRRLSAITNLANQFKLGKILDFGCGDGGMIDVLASNFESIGIEPDQGARNIAIQKSFKIYESADLAIKDNLLVDAVTLFHVVEHFYDPSKELDRIHKLLKPNGLLILETPNSNDALLTKYENPEFQNFTYWSHHPMLHSHESLDLLVSRNNFKVLENQGVQRYDLNNHLYWLTEGLPGGHEIWKDFLSGLTLESYSKDLIDNKICDTLWMVAQKVD